MKAIKENKEYTINSDAKAAYQEAGYDIFDDNGKNNIEVHGICPECQRKLHLNR